MKFDTIQRRLKAYEHAEFGLGATDDEIDKAESVLGTPLRGSYRAFLETFGWGGVEDIEIFGLGADVPNYLNLVAVAESERTEAQPQLPSHLVPVTNDGGGNLYCLDASEPYREEFPVVFWDHDRQSSQTPDLVAESFAEWLSDRLDQRQ